MNNRTSIIYLVATLVAITLYLPMAQAKSKQVIEPSYAWSIKQPLGLHFASTIDTLHYNYFATAIPHMASKAYATTGNYGAPGQTQIFFDRKQNSEFFLADNMHLWLPSTESQRFFNTRIPMTLVSYTFAGNRDNNQDRLRALFSGNISKKLAVGAELDYVYSKGSYNFQADKNFIWRLFGSYIGDRYEAQTFFNNFNFLTKENGGITDDRYITDPAEVQGGVTNVDQKTIPTNLDNAHSKLMGHQFYMNHRYKVGYYRTQRDSIADSVRITRIYVPMTSFIWTMDYQINHHKFLNQNGYQDTTFFRNTYLNFGGTDDNTRMWRLTNTVGIDLLENSRSWAKFGLSAYATYEIRHYTLPTDSMLSYPDRPTDLTPLDLEMIPAHTGSENVAWAGGQLTRRTGSRLNYDIDARFGLLGSAVGDVNVEGNIYTRFPLKRDSIRVNVNGYFKNEEAPYLLKHYISNHFAWNKDFSKVQRFRIGGDVYIPISNTRLSAGYETLNNYIYFNEDGLPQQHSGAVHVFSATIDQRLKAGILHWDNSVTYQASSHGDILSLPKISVYSNLYLLFKIAGVLHTQFGIDCNYYTSYYAPRYNPATMQFQNQQEQKCGNFAMSNLYANFKLKKTRFFIMFSHFNDGLFGGKSCFSSPHYPLNPKRLQFGVSVDFAH